MPCLSHFLYIMKRLRCIRRRLSHAPASTQVCSSAGEPSSEQPGSCPSVRMGGCWEVQGKAGSCSRGPAFQGGKAESSFAHGLWCLFFFPRRPSNFSLQLCLLTFWVLKVRKKKCEEHKEGHIATTVTSMLLCVFMHAMFMFAIARHLVFQSVLSQTSKNLL